MLVKGAYGDKSIGHQRDMSNCISCVVCNKTGNAGTSGDGGLSSTYE